jgi:hypothetical protein
VRMFDNHEPLNMGLPNQTATTVGQRLRQDWCGHVWGKDPISVKVVHLPDDDWDGIQVEGKAFTCDVCGAYLVMYDRAG